MTNKPNKGNTINYEAGLVYVIMLLQLHKPHTIKWYSDCEF
jgi:hypothetical protein